MTREPRRGRDWIGLLVRSRVDVWNELDYFPLGTVFVVESASAEYVNLRSCGNTRIMGVSYNKIEIFDPSQEKQ